MVALTNFALVMHQNNNINNEQDLKKFNNSVEALKKYTPIVDLALGLICLVGAAITAPSPLASGLAIGAVVFFLSGFTMLLSNKNLESMAAMTNLSATLQFQLKSLEAQLAAAK